MSRSRRPVAALAVAGVAVVGLGACISEPSARRVAHDIIEAQVDLEPAVRQCMLDKLEDDSYTNQDLRQITEDNSNVDFSVEDPDVSEEWQRFVDDLAECNDLAGEPHGSVPAASLPEGSEPEASEPQDSGPGGSEPE